MRGVKDGSSGFGDALCSRMHVFSYGLASAVRCVLKVLKREGTVVPAPNFSAGGDAGVLDKAIKVKGEAADATRFGFFGHVDAVPDGFYSLK